jgi:hypothetical protein
MTNPEPPSTAPVAWCQSEDFRNALFKRQSFSGWREQHPDCDMPLYAQPQASTAPDAGQAEGPSLADVVDLCVEFEYHIDSDDDYSFGILRDMITAAITRWRAPVAEPVAPPAIEISDEIELENGWTRIKLPDGFLIDLPLGPVDRRQSDGSRPNAGNEEALCVELADGTTISSPSSLVKALKCLGLGT